MPWNERTSRQVTPDLEIFVLPPNDQGFASIVIDASTVTPDANGDRILKAGTLLAKNASNQYERFTDDATQDCRGVLSHTVKCASVADDQPASMAFHSEVFRADRIVDFATPAVAAAARAAMPTCLFR